MIEEPLIGCHVLFLCGFVVFVDPGQRLNDVPALFGEAVNNVHEVSPGMGHAVAQNGPESFGYVPGKRLR